MMTKTRLQELRDAHMVRALKYASVSVVGIVVTQVLLVLAYQVLDWSAAWSNFVAVSGASIPAYLLNRAWVWKKTGRHSVHREVLPFWGISLLGLVISTIAVGWISQRWDSQLAVSGTNIASFGVLWVGKYLYLDKLMFGAGHHGPDDLEALADDDGPAFPSGTDAAIDAGLDDRSDARSGG